MEVAVELWVATTRLSRSVIWTAYDTAPVTGCQETFTCVPS